MSARTLTLLAGVALMSGCSSFGTVFNDDPFYRVTPPPEMLTRGCQAATRDPGTGELTIKLPPLTDPSAGAVVQNHAATVDLLYPCALRAARWAEWWRRQAAAERNAE